MVVGHAGVDEPGDARVLERLEDLALGGEAARLVGVDAPPHDLDGRPARLAAVVALGEVDDAHPTRGEMLTSRYGPARAGRVGHPCRSTCDRFGWAAHRAWGAGRR